jgi:hypothetical protein
MSAFLLPLAGPYEGSSKVPRRRATTNVWIDVSDGPGVALGNHALIAIGGRRVRRRIMIGDHVAASLASEPFPGDDDDPVRWPSAIVSDFEYIAVKWTVVETRPHLHQGI